MKIQFLIDYRGAETNGLQYHAGDVALFPPAFAARLVSDKVAIEFVEPKPVKRVNHKQEADDGRTE